MTVIDKVYVVSRGWVIVTETNDEIRLTDKVLVNGKAFSIFGIEKVSWSNKVGLMLRPNGESNEAASVGDTLEIIKSDL